MQLLNSRFRYVKPAGSLRKHIRLRNFKCLNLNDAYKIVKLNYWFDLDQQLGISAQEKKKIVISL